MPERPRLRDHPWLGPMKRAVRWWRRFQRGPVLHTYPWYMEWFRHPDRVWGVSKPMCYLSGLASAVLLFVVNDSSMLLVWIALHLLLWARTVQVRARYGVSEPTPEDIIPLAEEIRLARRQRGETD